MGASYHSFCPTAKAMELLDERWTLLVVRELVAGTEHFNEMRRALPRMSPSLLSKRLHQLSVAGILERRTEGAEVRYVLTEAGRDLRPVVVALTDWGTRWIGELGEVDLDPKLLMWEMHYGVRHEELPPGRTVLQFRFPGTAGRAGTWWFVVEDGETDVCDTDPGFEPLLRIEADLRTLTRVWRGDVSWDRVLSTGDLRVAGPEEFRRVLPQWFRLPRWASVERATTPLPV